MKLSLYYQKTEGSDRSCIETLEDELADLEDSDKIESYWVMTTPSGVPRVDDPTRGGMGRSMTKRYEEYRSWESREGLQLGAGFRERTTGTNYIEFPELFLEVRKKSEVRGVFPCCERVDGDLYEYSIENYLEALKTEEDWRTHRPEKPTRLSHTEHDAIQVYLKKHMEEINPDWAYFGMEYSLENTQRTTRNARVDLVFKHKHESERYLLVEVKPDQESVDEAFGQVLRYRHAFCDIHSTPNLDPDQIELAIAAPEIGEYHKQAASELGIGIIIPSY